MIDLASEKLLTVADVEKLLGGIWSQQQIREWMEPGRAAKGKPVLEATKFGGRIVTTVRCLNDFQKPLDSSKEDAGEDEADQILRREHGIGRMK